MTNWRDVAFESEFQAGKPKRLTTDDYDIVVFFYQNEYFAYLNSCTHAGAPLDSIDLVNGMILCPFHGACFDVMTGKPKGPPAFNHLKKFATRVYDGRVQVACG